MRPRELDVHLIRSTGSVALATGLEQVLFTSVIGFLLTVRSDGQPVHTWPAERFVMSALA